MFFLKIYFLKFISIYTHLLHKHKDTHRVSWSNIYFMATHLFVFIIKINECLVLKKVKLPVLFRLHTAKL